MSAYKKIKCTLADKNLLIKALDELGLKHEVHTSPQNLIGYTGDTRPEKAEIIVRRASLNGSFTGASNDLGFTWNAADKQYDAIVSDYDKGQMVNRIKQAYASCAIKEALIKSKFSVTNITGDLTQRTKTKVNMVATKII